MRYPTLKPGDTIRCHDDLEADEIRRGLSLEGIASKTYRRDGKWIVEVVGKKSGRRTTVDY